MKKLQVTDESAGLTPAALSLKSEIDAGTMPKLKEMTVYDCDVVIRHGSDSLWIFVTRGGFGGFGLRAGYSPGQPLSVEAVEGSDRDLLFHLKTSLGGCLVRVITPNSEEASIRCTVELTPDANLLVANWPRDLYPIDSNGNPAAAQGVVKAAQRGLNVGVAYLAITKPAFGSLLYYQNYTALNDYFRATGTRPDGTVGGNWPELGYEPPPSSSGQLRAGTKVTISDAFVGWTDEHPQSPQHSARLFLQLMAGVYRRLARPGTEFHDWPKLAKKTLADLRESPKATLTAYGHKYLHPYTDAEYPDSMVQLTVLMALREFASRDEAAGAFASELLEGVPKFFDKKLGVIRRYLPNVGKDKNKDEVDSWYLYHPIANLGRLVSEGEEKFREMFLSSVEFGIKAAQHFNYIWPVQFDIETFDVIKEARKPGDPGQSDTGGLFAYVMVQAYRLTSDTRYLSEAQKAVHALSDMQFELEYQANITGWGANACLQLSLITNDDKYLDQSLVFLAGVFHNSVTWESNIANARHYSNFLAPTCLHDGPYMALYECYELFAAYHEYLSLGKTHVPHEVRLLLSEYIKYAPTRAWYYYPQNLPKEAIATKVRNGGVDRNLAFPLEDLYADGQPAGQVGQEIYGCGAAFSLVTRSYHVLRKSPWFLYCEYPIFDLQELDEARLAFRVRGVEGFYCKARLISANRAKLPIIVVCSGEGINLHVHLTEEGHYEFTVPAAGSVEIRWAN